MSDDQMCKIGLISLECRRFVSRRSAIAVETQWASAVRKSEVDGLVSVAASGITLVALPMTPK